MKKILFTLCSIILFSSCSKDDDNDNEKNEKAKIEAYVTDYYQNKYLSNKKGTFVFVSFIQFEKSTDKLEDSLILKEVNRKYKEHLITKTEYEKQILDLNENFTGITYYVIYENFIKYEDESKNTGIFKTYSILNNKGHTFFITDIESQK